MTTKLVRFLDENDCPRWGFWESGSEAIPVEDEELLCWFNTHPTLDQRGTTRIARFLPPVPPWPPNVFGIGLNYRAHAAEGNRPPPDKPLIFIKASTSVIGPGDAIVLPSSAPDEVDFEAELAVVIGRTARRVPVDRAGDFILGYTCANDVSARDCQKRLDGQWARGKSFDTFCPLGPCLVNPHEFDPQDADIMSTLNGRRMQESRTSDMIFSCAELVSYLSHQFTLLPWTVICTGTPAGVGVARTPPVYLRPGDSVTVSISGIGELTNPVTADRAVESDAIQGR